MWYATHNVGPIGSAVLTFIGYKQTNKQTDRETICKVNIIDVHCSAMHFEYQSKFLKIRSYWVWFCELLMKKKNKTEIIQIQQS